MLLPDLKAVTPVKSNHSNSVTVDQDNYSVNSKLINRKKSYERMIKLDPQLYQIYKYQGGKVDSQNIRSGGIHQYGLKQRPNIVYGSGSVASELDIQGKSVINSKQINSSYV